MASKHALLIGISTYGEGLLPIPSAEKDVAALAAVLLDPELGGFPEQNLQVLTNPGRTALASAVERLYENKEADDLLLLYFSGHGFRDNRRQLRLSSADSCKIRENGNLRLPLATTLAARDIHDYMETSGSSRKVVILDCCHAAAFAEGMAAKDDGTIAIEAMLGGKGCVVLTSSNTIELSQAPEAGDDLSVYTRFLVEGIRTGAADRQDRGYLEAGDLHDYAQRRVKEVAPMMSPQIFPTRDGRRIRICQVRRDPSAVYRREVQRLMERRNGSISPLGRAYLEALRDELPLPEVQAAQIEAEVFQPFRDYEAKRQKYADALRSTLQANAAGTASLTDHDQQELQELEQRLKLRPSDVAAIQRQLGISATPMAPQPQSQAAPAAAVEPSGLQPPAPPPATRQRGPTLLQISTQRGWLVRQGERWQRKTEPISVPGYRQALAPNLELTLLQIPKGQFEMGSPDNEAGRDNDEGPQNKVQLASFLLGQTPVTQAQWQEVAGWPKVTIELNPQPSRFEGANRPVERVRWHEAMEFCHRLRQRTGHSFTLPSEAQWEYACRAGTTTPFAFGETITTDLANYDGNYTYATEPQGTYRQNTTDVLSFPANAWGLHDMHGNVWEWCLDTWHSSYQGAPDDGSPWYDKQGENSIASRLLRGGSWICDPRGCRSAYRYGLHSDVHFGDVGFRVCCSPQD
ncbi:MAG: caspase, EACC1-associated type [Cyanobium sp.]